MLSIREPASSVDRSISGSRRQWPTRTDSDDSRRPALDGNQPATESPGIRSSRPFMPRRTLGRLRKTTSPTEVGLVSSDPRQVAVRQIEPPCRTSGRPSPAQPWRGRAARRPVAYRQGQPPSTPGHPALSERPVESSLRRSRYSARRNPPGCLPPLTDDPASPYPAGGS